MLTQETEERQPRSNEEVIVATAESLVQRGKMKANRWQARLR